MGNLINRLYETKYAIWFLILFAYFSTGCGSSTTVTGQQTSLYSGEPTTITSLGTALNLNCNAFSTTNVTMDGHIEAMPMAASYAKLRFTGMSTQLDSGASVQFFRWNTTTTGAANLDSAPLTFHLASGGADNILSQDMTALTAASLKSAAASSFASFTNSATFLASNDIILQGLDVTWKAIKIVMYSGTTVVASNDVLIPSFAANPSTYASGHPAVLAQLHPFYNQYGQTDQAYYNMSQGFCW